MTTPKRSAQIAELYEVIEAYHELVPAAWEEGVCDHGINEHYDRTECHAVNAALYRRAREGVK